MAKFKENTATDHDLIGLYLYSLGRNDKFQLLDGVCDLLLWLYWMECDLLLWLYWMECELLGLGDVKFELRDPDFVVGWDKFQSRTQ